MAKKTTSKRTIVRRPKSTISGSTPKKKTTTKKTPARKPKASSVKRKVQDVPALTLAPVIDIQSNARGISFNPAAFNTEDDDEATALAASAHGTAFVRMLHPKGTVKGVTATSVIARLMEGWRFLVMEPATPRYVGVGDVCDMAEEENFTHDVRDARVPQTIEQAEMSWEIAMSQDLSVFPNHPDLLRGFNASHTRKSNL